jgi:hypothetical protein
MNAKEMIMKRSTIAKAFTIAAVTALALGVVPTANAHDKGCSNTTLKGTFGHKSTGFITAPAALAGPLAHVSTISFDGNGAFTATGIVSQNGNIIDPVTETGTYTVNPDCTGTYTSELSPLGITAHVFFVIDDSGNEFQLIETDPGTVLTGVTRRQFPVRRLRGDPDDVNDSKQ